MYACESWTVTQRMEDRMDATEKRMLRHINGISYEYHVVNTEISIQAGVKEISSFMRKRRLQRHYVGHVCQRERKKKKKKNICHVTNIQVWGDMRRGRLRQQWRYSVKSDMSHWGLEQEDVRKRVRWNSLIKLGASRTATRYGYSRLGQVTKLRNHT